MPEYLAPGVYVEETSFRAKSIEGVGTSTTSFVGPARRGPAVPPVGDTQPPSFELLTSFGDFVRIYGGLESLGFAPDEPNYLAHSVLNFFNEGGSRLYVARVHTGAKSATLALKGDPANPADAARIVALARYPGGAGNGQITLNEILTPASLNALQNASAGALLRAAGNAASAPARLTATQTGPYTVPNGARLRLVVSGSPLDLDFHGQSTEATAAAPLGVEPMNIAPSDQTLTVTLNGVAQALQLAANYPTHAALAFDINRLLAGGYARLNGQSLVIGTDHRGFGGRVQVSANASLGFTAAADVSGVRAAGTNNVGDLASVTDVDLTALIADHGGVPAVAASLAGGRLALATTALGEGQTLAVADATNLTPGLVSAHAGLGLAPLAPGQPAARGSNVRLFMKQATGATGAWASADNTPFPLPADGNSVAGSLVTLTLVAEDSDGESDIFDEVSLVRGDPRYLGTVLAPTPSSRDAQLNQIFAFDIGEHVSALDLHDALFPAGGTTGQPADGLSSVLTLAGGDDGSAPVGGATTMGGTYAAALEHLLALEDVSIVAAPGHSAYDDYPNIQGLLRSHVERQRAYRIAVLDTPPGLTPSGARLERARIDSTRLALYYPWVTVSNPLARPGRDDIPREIDLPPSGFLCGIYARNDVNQSVAKAPANEVVNGALRFERDVNFAENQLLNPLGVNCLRFFPGRGYRVWGARLASSDPEWKYVNVRRYFLYLEASIDQGTQWAVFENNGPRLWANIRETIEAFLNNEWVSGNLLGSTAKEAFFVRCDRSTMTQNDLDNGRLICLIGVAVLKPAEFVIFRIGQKTADERS